MKKKNGQYIEDQMPSVGSSKARDDQLAQKGEPLGSAVEANQEKKRTGVNRPAT
ncbi:hypothetical protein [Mechercharimyces sp. CAU 1602]|uniref:hypothetical protein n=1 Tax=Mechercharimyces sp. CAU 1602 TaxID=2973933 RepID=UPI0021631068|nr:hypothetical protein [Mechercharimyces sp. CAU 1602]MCS1350408.1 hypothetical protein [Mechercharimyces sp. CAU 1602]